MTQKNKIMYKHILYKENIFYVKKYINLIAFLTVITADKVSVYLILLINYLDVVRCAISLQENTKKLPKCINIPRVAFRDELYVANISSTLLRSIIRSCVHAVPTHYDVRGRYQTSVQSMPLTAPSE